MYDAWLVLALEPGSALRLIDTVRSNGGFGKNHDEPSNQHVDARARILGAACAQHGDTDVLYDMLKRRGSYPDLVDFFACWCQELVVRGATIGGPQIDEFAEWLVAKRHPLAHLPMHRLPIECDVPYEPAMLRPTSASGWSCGFAWWDRELLPAIEPIPSATEVTVASDARIGATFDSHRTVSNGRFEARVFALDPQVPRMADPALLASLPMACVEGVTSETTYVRALAPGEAFALLLAYASNGGDYNRTWSGAYGRRDAWKSLGGLTGSPVGATLHEIERSTRTTHWAHFLGGRWFYGVMTDLGIAAIGERGDSIAVLAGTDTD